MRELMLSRENGDALLRTVGSPYRRNESPEEPRWTKGRKRERRDGPLSMYEAINLARQIASSLVRSQANC